MEILILNNEFYLLYAGLSCAYDNALLLMSYIYNDNMFFNNNYMDELFLNKQDKDVGKLLFKFRKKTIFAHAPSY
jgi:DNA polymerase sigma